MSKPVPVVSVRVLSILYTFLTKAKLVFVQKGESCCIDMRQYILQRYLRLISRTEEEGTKNEWLCSVREFPVLSNTAIFSLASRQRFSSKQFFRSSKRPHGRGIINSYLSIRRYHVFENLTRRNSFLNGLLNYPLRRARATYIFNSGLWHRNSRTKKTNRVSLKKGERRKF